MFKILRLIVKVFMGRYTVIGKENIIEDYDAVFVCNHSGVFGPMAMVLFFPYRFRPWVTYHTMSKKLCRIRLKEDLFSNAPKVLRPFCLLLARILEPICIWIMRKVDAIPVYGGKSEIFKTFRISVDALAQGDNIVLFIDDMQKRGGGRRLNSGFVHLARKYYNKFGKNLKFYPVHVYRKMRVIVIGKPIDYMPETGFTVERERISKALLHSILLK